MKDCQNIQEGYKTTAGPTMDQRKSDNDAVITVLDKAAKQDETQSQEFMKDLASQLDSKEKEAILRRARNGPETGANLFGHSHFTLTTDGQRKMYLGHLTFGVKQRPEHLDQEPTTKKQ